MRVVINLFTVSAYQDRFRLLCTLSEHVDALTLLTDTLTDTARQIASHYPRLTVVELGRQSTVRKAGRWLRSAVSRNEVDVIHDTFGFLAPFFQVVGPMEDRNFKLVTTLYTSNWQWFHHVRTPEFDVNWTYMRQRITTLWRDRRVCRAADRVMVLGPGHDRALIRGHGIRADKIVWCPAEVDVDKFYPQKQRVKRRAVITFSGAVCRNKGIDILFEAAMLLKNRGIDFELRIIGRVLFWERNWFSNLCRRFDLGDRVVHLGQVEHNEMLTLYQSSVLFVFPSRFEGSPRSVREALSCGVPCVLSDIPGNRGVDPQGKFVRFVNTEDAQLWATAIGELLTESPMERQRRSDAGRRHMERHHSFDAVAARWAQVYGSIASKSPSKQL